MDELINAAAIDLLRESLSTVVPTVATPQLELTRVMVDDRRLRERVDLVRGAMLADLPGGFVATEEIIDGLLSQPRFTGWIVWPTTEFVATRALEEGSERAFDSAMALLARLTTRLSSEFAIRNMLLARPERALTSVLGWTADENEHVRRLASEGTRSHLPWGRRVPWLVDNPDATGPILDALYRDRSEYVRRSVANHLNDLSRLSPAVAVAHARAWTTDPDENTARVVRHGLRTLVKRADPAALALVGYSGDRLRVGPVQLSTEVVAPEGSITFTARIENEGDRDAVASINYTIGFLRANGSMSPKTFVLATRSLAAGEEVTVSKTHSFRRITTRRYYPGRHVLTVEANGARSPEVDFVLQTMSETQPPAIARGEGS
ncbi:hypothetical protein [Microbacterium invictum]|uniref:DNA alkylation repair protein n=1 Tax=Microbacterium invictum TaxID=515415 RepID=A0ABZ0VIR4_9MICO|nr:hypothetical protein [Microbacterium invictum]WQB72105.1 hypothetical protein T9R20_00570 [Microbacterium invictum]